MACLRYTITNLSSIPKEFVYGGCTSPIIYDTVSLLGLEVIEVDATSSFPPQQLTTGVPEDVFLSEVYSPPTGYAWLWNDGYKVKHIKLSNTSANGNNISSFIQHSDWIKFQLTEARNADGNYTHPSNPLISQNEQYILNNSTIKNGYSHLFVDQNNLLTSFAVSSSNPSNPNFNFTGEGDIIIYDTLSGDIAEPIFDTNPNPQGYFPKNILDIEKGEQIFRQWNGSILDSLGFFNSSTGVYTYNLATTENLEITASVTLTGSTPNSIPPSNYDEGVIYGDNEVVYGGNNNPDAIVWETASLLIYRNNIIFQESEIYINDISSSITITLSNNFTPQINDEFKISLLVTGSETNILNINSALLVTDFYLNISASTPPTSNLVSTYFDNSLQVIDDCNPLLNNISNIRTNDWLMDVDYSVNALNPVNFNQLINFTALKATTPRSNYTQLGLSNPRYNGSSTTRDNVNEYNPQGVTDPINKLIYADSIIDPQLIDKGKGPSLGKIPNVELNNAYIGYFNKIIDPYPLLNGKTAYYVKYLIDENGQIFEPSLSNINYDIFTKTFRLYDYDLKPTRVNVSIQNIDEAKELSKLEKGLASTYRIGEYPVPILYTQISSIDYTNNIILSGSSFYGTLGLNQSFTNFGSNIFSSQPLSAAFPNADGTSSPNPSQLGTDSTHLTFGAGEELLDFNNTNITLFDESIGVFATSSIVDGAILFPLDSATSSPGAGNNLSDNYRVEGSFEFFTSAIPNRYKRADGDSEKDNVWDKYKNRNPDTRNNANNVTYPIRVNLYPYIKTNNNSDAIGEYVSSLNNINIKSVTLTLYTDAGKPTEKSYGPFTLTSEVGFGNPITKNYSTNSIYFAPNNLYIEKLIIENIVGGSYFNGNNRLAARDYLFAPWYRKPDGSVDGWSGKTLIYKWSINFEVNNLKQLNGFYLKTSGELRFTYDGGDRDDIFALTGIRSVGKTLQKHSRTFTPYVGGSFNTQPTIKYNITSPLAEQDNNKNGATGPYWRRVPSTSDVLYMSSSILNQTYGKNYIQGKLDYVSGPNIDFPLTIEPDFVEFDPITDPWKLELGDEIRFENNENFVYTIINIKEPGNVNSENISDKLQITLSPSFEGEENNKTLPTNFDFFVIRRYKENRNFIILDQQKPYGFPVSKSSSPGVLLPEYRIKKFNYDPDIVLKDLIEKSII